jgi:hypothetical protein
MENKNPAGTVQDNRIVFCMLNNKINPKIMIVKKVAGLLIGVALLAGLAGCNKEDSTKSGTGSMRMYLTDASIDDSNVKAVWITVKEINMKSSGGWESLSGFNGPKKFNLMDLRDSTAVFLGEEKLPAGSFSEIRFVVDAPDENGPASSNPGCYIEYKDGSTQPLYIPSGSESGFKAKGSFDVPVNGTVDVTADFDARKSIVIAGSSGKYLLKPVIRIVVNNQAGAISGTATNTTSNKLVIYAYENGTYSNTEDDDPASGNSRFPNAVTSALVDSSGHYILAYLAAGTYDLAVVANNPDGSFNSVLGFVPDVVVTSKMTTSTNLNTGSLATNP